jgi:ABC-2 type transport system ATP-binding protein
VGVNGAGKTTLIKHLLGLLRPTSGTVRVLGLDPVRDPVNTLRRVGYLSEQREMPEWMRIDELMRYTQAYYPTWDMRYARELLQTFGLDAKKQVGGLSQGMRAQTGLVVAVAHRPEILILDEPSSGLDAIVRQDILDAIVRTVADEGRTVIFSSHLLDEVQRMSDRVTMIHEGRIVLDGERDEICASHHVTQLRFTQRYERFPELDGVLKASGAARAWSVVHGTPVEGLAAAAGKLGGEIAESRDATLEEIFVARCGRSVPPAQAA